MNDMRLFFIENSLLVISNKLVLSHIFVILYEHSAVETRNYKRFHFGNMRENRDNCV